MRHPRGGEAEPPPGSGVPPGEGEGVPGVGAALPRRVGVGVPGLCEVDVDPAARLLAGREDEVGQDLGLQLPEGPGRGLSAGQQVAWRAGVFGHKERVERLWRDLSEARYERDDLVVVRGEVVRRGGLAHGVLQCAVIIFGAQRFFLLRSFDVRVWTAISAAV